VGKEVTAAGASPKGPVPMNAPRGEKLAPALVVNQFSEAFPFFAPSYNTLWQRSFFARLFSLKFQQQVQKMISMPRASLNSLSQHGKL
jgi:hypothetical protein